jgi:hypothetical protein
VFYFLNSLFVFFDAVDISNIFLVIAAIRSQVGYEFACLGVWLQLLSKVYFVSKCMKMIYFFYF